MTTSNFARARLLLLGAGPRLLGALAIIAALWLGFFWATGSFAAAMPMLQRPA